MVAVILLIILTLIFTLPPALKVLIILFASFKAIGTISYYIVYIKLKSALEAESERILQEYLNSNTYNTSDQQQNERS